MIADEKGNALHEIHNKNLKQNIKIHCRGGVGGEEGLALEMEPVMIYEQF